MAVPRRRAPGVFSPRLSQKAGRVRLRAPGGAWVLGIYMGFVLLLCVGGLVSAFHHPHRHDDAAEKAALFVLVVLVAGLLYRIWRSGTLEATPLGILVRTVVRTHRLSWAEVQSFEEVVRAISLNQIRRRVLRVVFVDGGHHDFTELNGSVRMEPDVIADTARYLNVLKPTITSTE